MRKKFEASILVINDCSTESFQEQVWSEPHYRALRQIEILNLGHQRAIAVALAYVQANKPETALIMIDADGEDDSKEIPKLIEAFHFHHGQKIIFAERAQRSESYTFIIFYNLYRYIHYLLTGLMAMFIVIFIAGLESY